MLLALLTLAATVWALGLKITALLAVVVFATVIVSWGLADAVRRPDHAWKAAGLNKTLWVGLQVGGLLLALFGGAVMAIIYLVTVRPKLQATETSAAQNASQPL